MTIKAPTAIDLMASIQKIRGGPGAMALAAWGMWAGVQAKQFHEPMIVCATSICLIAASLGVTLLTITVCRSVFAKQT